MTSMPWEPCPRCGEKHVEVTPKSKDTGTGVGILVGIGFVVYIAFGIFSDAGFSFGSFMVAIAVTALLTAILSPAIIAGSAIVGGAAGAMVKGYHAKCKTCSFEWDISEERAKELQAQTHAQ